LIVAFALEVDIGKLRCTAVRCIVEFCLNNSSHRRSLADWCVRSFRVEWNVQALVVEYVDTLDLDDCLVALNVQFHTEEHVDKLVADDCLVDSQINIFHLEVEDTHNAEFEVPIDIVEFEAPIDIVEFGTPIDIVDFEVPIDIVDFEAPIDTVASEALTDTVALEVPPDTVALAVPPHTVASAVPPDTVASAVPPDTVDSDTRTVDFADSTVETSQNTDCERYTADYILGESCTVDDNFAASLVENCTSQYCKSNSLDFSRLYCRTAHSTASPYYYSSALQFSRDTVHSVSQELAAGTAVPLCLCSIFSVSQESVLGGVEKDSRI
jgi:hypothetical protein